MGKNVLKFERSNLIPKTSYEEIKRSPAIEISPYLFRIQVVFFSHADLDERTLKTLEGAGEKVINDTQDKMMKPLREFLEKVSDEYTKEIKKPDPKSFERVKKLAKSCLAEIENMAEGLPGAIRSEIDGKLKTSVKEKVAKIEKKPAVKKEKTQTIGTMDFLDSGDGIRIKKGVFSGGADGEDADDALKEAMKNAKARSHNFILFASGSKMGLVVQKAAINSEAEKSAKEEAGNSGSKYKGTLSYKNGTYFFEVDKNISDSKESALAKLVRTELRKRCKISDKIDFGDGDADNED